MEPVKIVELEVYKVVTNGFYVNHSDDDLVDTKQDIKVVSYKRILDLDINYGIDTRIDVHHTGVSFISETYDSELVYVKEVLVSLSKKDSYNEQVYFMFRNLLLGEMRTEKLDFLIDE